MIEREMQELLWRYPERFLNEPLTQFAWETQSNVGRADLVFEDRHGRLLIIEVKRGKLPRGAIDQLLDYFGMMKLRFPGKPVELMGVANAIPPERRIACESRDIECREISEKTFRDVAEEFAFAFTSEASLPQPPPEPAVVPSARANTNVDKATKGNPNWSFNRQTNSTPNALDFLSRCDDEGKDFFTKLFAAQKAASNCTKITWKHESGFSLQFYFHRVGFVSIVWGFPSTNREGRSVRQRLDFPFDLSLKAGVSKSFVNEFGASMSSLVPFAGGGQRPSISVAALSSGATTHIIETIFTFALKASKEVNVT